MFQLGSLEHMAYRAICYYPDLYSNRESFLLDLYCVMGNGYRWERGELKGTEFNNCYPIKMDPLRFLEVNLFPLSDEDEIEYYKFVISTASERIKPNFPYSQAPTHIDQLPVPYIPELRKHCPLMSIPDDASPQFLSGAIEVCNYIKRFEDTTTIVGKSNVLNANRILSELFSGEIPVEQF